MPSSVSVGFVDGALTSLEAEGPATGGGPEASWLYGTEATRAGEGPACEADAEVLFFLPKMEAMSAAWRLCGRMPLVYGIMDYGLPNCVIVELSRRVSSAMSFYLAVVSPRDSPLFELAFASAKPPPPPAAAAPAFPSWSALTGDSPAPPPAPAGPLLESKTAPQRDRALCQMVAHMSLDSIEETMETTGALYVRPHSHPADSLQLSQGRRPAQRVDRLRLYPHWR